MTDKHARHQAIYATPNLPPFNYDQVAGRLYAGRNPLSAVDVDLLCELGITHLLDLREPQEWLAPRFGEEALAEIGRRGLTRLHLLVVDAGVPTEADLDEACRFIEAALANPNARVYVHCRAGEERTSAVLVAFHASRNGLTYGEALAELRVRRPSLRPHGEGVVRAWLGKRR